MCTTLRIKANDGAVVVGRTMEFGIDPKSELMAVPAGTEATGTLPQGASGIRYTTKFGMIGATALGLRCLVDGVNDQGLYVGDLYFPGFADYSKVDPGSESRAMACYELGHWLLGSFACVEEVRASIGGIVLAATPIQALNNAVPPLHFTIHDRSGAALVLEPLDGKLVVRENPIGVLTNAPALDWHLTNLRNYIGLNPYNKSKTLLGDYALDPVEFGNGTGMFGLPGDSAPTSRFVRAVAFSQAALPVETGKDAVHQVFHLMNNFDIPPGSVRDDSDGEMRSDTTAWTTVVDLKNGTWAFRTYKNQNLRQITLRDALAACRGQARIVPMESAETISDVSSMFNNNHVVTDAR